MVDLLLRYRFASLCLVAIAVAVSLFFAGSFRLERTLESMFHPTDVNLRDYQLLKEDFGGNEVILFVIRDDEFWTKEPLDLGSLLTLHDRIASLDGIQSVMDLTVIDRLIRTAEPSFGGFLSSQASQGIASESGFSQAMLGVFENFTHAANKRPWLSFACLLDPRRKEPTSTLLRDLRNLGEETGKEYYLVGEPVMIEDGFDFIEGDGVRLAISSSIILIAFLIFVYRDIVWSLLMLAIVHSSIAITQAICVVVGWKLTMISSMLVSIVTVIGIATTMHWLHRYQEAAKQGHDPESSLRLSFHDVLKPIFWSCLTDAAAFGSLTIAMLEPVKDYGLMMCIASLVTLFVIVLTVPGWLSLPWFRRFHRSGLLRTDKSQLGLLSQLGLKAVLVHRRRVWGTLILLLLLTAYGLPRLKVETNFLNNFRSDSALVQGYQVVEQELGGAGVWDIVLPAPNRLTTEYLDAVDRFEKTLIDGSGGKITKAISLADAECASRLATAIGSLPLELRLQGMKAAMPDFFATLITQRSSRELQRLRIMLRSPDIIDASKKRELIAFVQRSTKELLASDEFHRFLVKQGDSIAAERAIVTGYYVLLNSLVASVISDQWLCFGLAVIATTLLLRMSLRSLRLSLAAIFINAFPSLVLLSILGLLNVAINIGTVMIAAVSLGLSVDSSIHYGIAFQRRIADGLSTSDAVHYVQSEVGIPVMISTLSLAIGFGSLAFSQFVPTIWFGGMAAASMLLGMIANLTLFPLFIVGTSDDRSEATKSIIEH